jgi:hypothetical protein
MPSISSQTSAIALTAEASIKLATIKIVNLHMNPHRILARQEKANGVNPVHAKQQFDRLQSRLTGDRGLKLGFPGTTC